MYAQTQEQIEQINKSYDFSEINSLKIKYEKHLQKNKKQVEAYAKNKNIPVEYRNEKGNRVWLAEIYKGLPIYLTTNTTQASYSTRTNWLFENEILNLNLQAENLTAYVWDSGHARITHQDLQNENLTSKINIGEGLSNYILDNHSTHVTGIIASTGENINRSRGMAKKAQIKSYEFTDAEVEAISELGNGILVSNHSYGFSSSQIQSLGLSEIVGAYVSRSKRWDSIAFVAPYYLPITSAGNDGSFAYNSDPIDPANPEYDKLTGMKTSKNTLVVANANPASISASGELISVNINSSSSQGPTDDLRIKPDLTGIGTQVYSTTSSADNAYGYLTGTSMASPNVTGTLLLLQELYEREVGNFMKAATLKGLALHTADDAGLTGPDAIYGWGLLNAKKAAQTITDKNKNKSLIIEDVLVDGNTYTLNVNANEIENLEISISWTDPAGSLSTTANDLTPILVNDLNLKVTQGATDYFPWKLTGVNTNTKGVNNVDPFEKIDINNASGTYTIEISHAGSLTNLSQNFSLIVTGYTNGIVSCAPIQNITETAVNPTSHNFTWSASLDEVNGYEWAIVEAGKHPDEHSLIQSGNVSTGITSVSILNLSPATQYSFFVRTKCSSEESEWNHVDFSTACQNITQFPFEEHFSTSSASLSCWSVDAVSTASWAFTNAGSNFGTVLTSLTENQNATFIPDGTEELGLVSPFFDVSGFGDVQLSFQLVLQNNAGNQNELKVFFEEQGNAPIEIDHITATFSEWTEISLPLTTTATPFRIILKGISKSGPQIAIDHFRIEYDGFHFRDWVWQPRNPENFVSTLTDDVWVENKTARLNLETKANTIQIDANASLEIADVLEINNSINGSGKLVFKNNASQLGQLATLPVSATISTTTEVERWIPAGNENTRAFRMLASPVTSTNSIFDNWQESGNQPEGFGTHITGSTTGLNGFDTTTTGNPSLYWFDHASSQSGGAAWNNIANTNINTISAGYPYRIYIRGDRNISLNSNTSTPTNTKLRTEGNLHTGDYSPTLATGDEQFSFIGNPYQAIVNANLLTYNGDINSNYIYIWDPNLNTNGGFVSVNTSTGSHATTSDANQFIQPGQAFFIRNNVTVTTTPSINFTEASKAVDQVATQVFNESESTILNLRLFNANGENDAIRILLSDAFDNDFNDNDAGKLGNANENLAIIGNNQLWSIAQRKPLEHEQLIDLLINNYTQNDYSFMPVFENELTNTTLYLRDHYLNEDILLVHENPISFSINHSIAESASPFRFSIVSKNETLSNISNENTEILIYPNPTSDWVEIKIPKTSKLQSVEVIDILGQIHLFKEFEHTNSTTINLQHLLPGTYILKAQINGKPWTKKLIKN